jgi:protein TonB
MVWILLLLLAASPVRADDSHAKKEETAKESSDSGEHVYNLDAGIKAPRLVRQVNPDYTSVRGVRVKGSVVIGVVISSQGTPKDPRVVQSLQPDVDRCAVEAVRQWRFTPAQKDGKPVAVRVTIEVDFHSM